MYKKIYFLLTLCLLPFTLIVAQPKPTGFLKGKILDAKTNEPVAYATISLFLLKDSSLTSGAIAAENGEFIIQDIPFDTYYGLINFIGYKKRTIPSISISKATQLITTPILLEPSTITLGEVEVIGDKSLIDYKADKKVINVSQQLMATGGTAIEALENIPSVSTDMDGNIALRGSSNFKVLVNGKPSAFEGSEALKQIPAGIIDRIELITNPSAKYDPEGVGGIINVITKKETNNGLNGIINTTASTTGSLSGDVLLNFKKNKFNYYMGLNGQSNKRPGQVEVYRRTNDLDTVRAMDFKGNRLQFNTGWDAKVGIDYDLTKQDILSTNITTGIGNGGMERELRYIEYTFPYHTEDTYLITGNADNKKQFYTTNTSYQHFFKDKGHEFTARFFLNNSQGDEVESVTRNLLNPYQQVTSGTRTSMYYSLNADYVKPFNESTKLEAGYQLGYTNNTSTNQMDSLEYVSYQWINNPSATNHLTYQRQNQAIYGIFGSSYHFIDYQIGLRGEYTNRYILSHISLEKYPNTRWDIFPSIHLASEIDDTKQIQLNYSRRVKHPGEQELDPLPKYIDAQNIRVGNPALEPEYTDSYELNYLHQFKHFNISTEVYYKQTNNLIQRITSIDNNQVMAVTFANITHDYSKGLEISSLINIKKFLTIQLNGNYFNYVIKGQVIDDEISQSTNTWNASINNVVKNKKGGRLQIGASYNAPSVTIQGERDGFFVANFGLKQEFMQRKLSLGISMRDMFNTRKHAFTVDMPDYYIYREFSSKYPVVSFSLSYRINNYADKKAKNKGSENGPALQMESGDL